MENRNNFFSKVTYTFFLLLIFSGIAQAQITPETYEKAEYFLTNSLQKQVYHLEVIPNWTKDGSSFWHTTYTEDGKRFFQTQVSSGETLDSFDHFAFAADLSKISGETVDPKALPFDRIEIKEDGEIGFEWKNKNWVYKTIERTLQSSPKTTQNNLNSSTSPDEKWRAFTRNFNLFIQDLETGVEIQLSFEGKQDFEYASYYGWSDLIEGEDGVRPFHFTVNWSPDSKKIQTQIVDLRIAEKMYLLDFSKDEKFRPDLLSYYRGSPGDSTVINYIPVIFELETKKETKFSDLTTPHFIGLNLRWEANSEKLIGQYFPRGFKEYSILEIDQNSGAIKKVFTEKSDTHINRENQFQKLTNGQFIINSEKSGWNHLYLFDWETGKLIRQLTSGEFLVKRVLHLDEEKQLLYFEASGKETGRNLYYPHLYQVRLDGSDLKLITPENAYHEIYLSPDKKYLIDNYSTVSQATKSVLRELQTGKILKEISTADISNLLAKGYQSPTPFSAIAKDGKTEIFGIYYLPTDFDDAKSYPVIDYTYSGPHIDITPKPSKPDFLVCNNRCLSWDLLYLLLMD